MILISKKTFDSFNSSSFIFLMIGVSYILFDSLKISDSGDKVQAPVWNRALVAEILFTSEKQLIELLILVGNKFTKGYGRKKYRSATGGGAPHRFFDQENNHTSDNMVSLAAMRDWILLQGVYIIVLFIYSLALTVCN